VFLGDNVAALTFLFPSLAKLFRFSRSKACWNHSFICSVGCLQPGTTSCAEC